MLSVLFAMALSMGMPPGFDASVSVSAPAVAVPMVLAQTRGRRGVSELPEEETVVQREWTEDDWVVLETDTYRLKYPKDWRVDAKSSGYDLEYHFSIDTPGESQITFEFFEWEQGLQLDEVLRNTLFAFDGVAIQTMSRSDFNRWGVHEGRGMHLKGKILGIVPGGCRVFVGRSGTTGFLITEFYHAPELQVAMPGFDLIGQTLEVL